MGKFSCLSENMESTILDLGNQAFDRTNTHKQMADFIWK